MIRVKRVVLLGVGLALLGCLVFLGSEWFAATFPWSFFGLALFAAGLVVACASLIAGTSSLLQSGPNTAVRPRVVAWPVAGIVAVLVLGASTVLAERPLMGLNFRTYLPERTSVAVSAQAAARGRSTDQPTVDLPPNQRYLSDGGVISLEPDGVIFWEFAGVLGGRAWFYTTYRSAAEGMLTDPVQLAPNWWEGGL